MMPWFNKHQLDIKENLDLITRDVLEIYIFGSALWKDDPGDLDVLIVYDKDSSMAEIKSKLKPHVSGKPVHITALTLEEMAGDYNFTNHVKNHRFLVYDQTGWKI